MTASEKAKHFSLNEEVEVRFKGRIIGIDDDSLPFKILFQDTDGEDAFDCRYFAAKNVHKISPSRPEGEARLEAEIVSRIQSLENLIDRQAAQIRDLETKSNMPLTIHGTVHIRETNK